MKEVAKLQIKDRTELFQATAISMGMQPYVWTYLVSSDGHAECRRHPLGTSAQVPQLAHSAHQAQ